jgi:hypothetical protein
MADKFTAGYPKAKLKWVCTAMIEVLKNESQKEYVLLDAIASYYGMMGDRDQTFQRLETG